MLTFAPKGIGGLYISARPIASERSQNDAAETLKRTENVPIT